MGGLVVAGAVLAPRPASADVFPYVDRHGRVHLISIPDGAGTEAATEPARSPAPEPARPRFVETAAMAAPEPPAGRASRAEAMAQVPHLALIREAAAHYSLPPELLLAVMRVESGFNPTAVSRAGAMGLMQLMPATAREMMVSDPFDPRQNVFGGARLLRILINRFDGSVVLALAGYSAGAGAVARWGGIPPYPETTAYVINVLAIYHLHLVAGIEQPRDLR